MTHPLFEIVTTTAGAISIRNKVLNEIMHNPVGPWVEANGLYVEQSGLEEKLRAGGEDELVLFDVGLGAAANALAALHAARRAGAGARPLRIVSFERELELLRYAVLHADQFAHFAGYAEAIRTLLEKGLWQDDRITWELRHGDFLEKIESETQRPHLIYFDPYSSKVNGEMWSVTCFKKIRALARSSNEGGTVLYTYSQATPVRVAILRGGFFIGAGRATGLKEETTIAATEHSLLTHPLGEVWLGRWRRSHVQAPAGWPTEEIPALREWVNAHPQFRG